MPSRLLILGLDGATWDVLTPLSAMGVMPNLRRLMLDSALLELDSTSPCITPVAWTSFQTGCDPHEHAILDYRHFDHVTRQLCLNNATHIRRPTLFEEVSAAGEVVSLNLPLSFPPSAGMRGIVIGGLDSPSAKAVLAPYPAFADRLRAAGVPMNLKAVWKRVPTSFEELAARVAETALDFRGRARAARIADELVDWRLMFVQFQTLDALQHRAWHLLGIDEQSSVCSASVAKIHEAFHSLDQSIGDLAELAQRRDASLVVVSDHGFGPFRGKISLPHLLASRGLAKLSPLAHRIGHRLSRTGWRARKWLWRRARPGSSTAALERPLEMLLPIDWRQSRAVALHGDLAGLIYLNTPARFGGGPLTTPRLEEESRDETLAALREARHPETGESLFCDVYAAAERLGIDVLDQKWPDIIAIPTAGFQTRTKLTHGPQGLVIADRQLSGTHRQSGVLMLPRVGPTKARRAQMRDVAPTLLRLLGLPPGPDMSGCSLADSPPLADNGSRIDPAQGVPTPHLELSPAEQVVVETRLRDLGYLD